MLRHASICHAGAILYPAQCAGLVSTDMTNGTHLRALPYATRSDPQPARRQYPIGQPDSEARTSDPRISSCNTVSRKIQCKPPSPLIEQKCSPAGLRPWPMCRRVQGSSCGSGAPSWAISATARRSGVVYRKCGSTWGPATGFISHGQARPCTCCCVVATSRGNKWTSSVRKHFGTRSARGTHA